MSGKLLRILWLQWRDVRHPWRGGAEFFADGLIRSLVHRGFEVTLVSSWFKGLPWKEHGDYQIVRVADHDRYILHVPKILRNFVKEVDVVVEDTSKVPLYTPFLRREKKPVIALVHHLNREIYFEELPPTKALLAYLMETFMPPLYTKCRQTCFVAVSKSTRNELIKMGATPEKITVVSNGVDANTYKPKTNSLMEQKAEKPLILYVSRLKKYKRPHHAILAFREVVKSVPEAKLVVVGDGDVMDELRRLSRSLRLENKVCIKGWVSTEEKVELMQKSWVLVQTSKKEGFGLTVLEANACGTPAVGYDVPGLRDSIRHGETGILVPSGDVETLAEAITTLLLDDGFREKLSRNALEWSKQFSWDRSAEEFEKVVEGR